jgi:hypothetical protein
MMIMPRNWIDRQQDGEALGGDEAHVVGIERAADAGVEAGEAERQVR